ncbi:MAG: LysM peptidoglycan-binding domain-containing protein [Deltaproteobacteria bacterium]|nr:LysM peptidoglycan-binding domain-containing protein [Deltaproteobacteria bacterium]
MKNIIGKKYSGVISLLVILCFLIIPTLTFAQKLTHIVEEGDTLWDICEQYYGDSDLWPKLWEMNPFITNPHLLRKGDVITLFEKEPVKEEVKKVEAPPVEKAPATTVEHEVMGIDVSALTELNAIGTLYADENQVWGHIIASGDKKIMFSSGETVYVLFDDTRDLDIGERFLVGTSSELLKHPVTKEDLGRLFAVKGVLVLRERLGTAQKKDEYYEKKNVFMATIEEAYDSININDELMPYKQVASCILPVSLNKKITGNIVAAKNQLEIIHPNSIVYIDSGSGDGLKTGCVMDVIRQNSVPDPDSKGNIILPDITIGEILVIECRPGNSTAIVISMEEPISIGSYIKELSWEQTPEFLSALSDCPIK